MLPKSIQVLLFSATFPDRVIQYAERFAPNANSMRLKQQQLTVKGISQMYMDCPSEGDKYDVLVKLYGLMTIGSSVIFVKVSTQRPPTEGYKTVSADLYRPANRPVSSSKG